jgi:hypothetical protein
LTPTHPALKLVRASAVRAPEGRQSLSRGIGDRGMQDLGLKIEANAESPKSDRSTDVRQSPSHPQVSSRSPRTTFRCSEGPVPSTQTGTRVWTHPKVTHSKQRTGVEPSRNSIPAPSTLPAYHTSRGQSRTCGFYQSLITSHESRFSSRQWLQGRIPYNSLKIQVRRQVYPTITRAVFESSRAQKVSTSPH